MWKRRSNISSAQETNKTKTTPKTQVFTMYCMFYFVLAYIMALVSCVQELYKIPKKQRAEERKRTERELGGFLSPGSTV